MTFFATFTGIFFQKYVTEKTGRASTSVGILVCCMTSALLASIALQIP